MSEDGNRRAPGYNPNSLDSNLSNIFVRLDMQDQTLREVKTGINDQLNEGKERFKALEDWRTQMELERKWFLGWAACALSAVSLIGGLIGFLCRLIFAPHLG